MKTLPRPLVRILAVITLVLAANTPLRAQALTLTWDSNTGTTGAQDGAGNWTAAGTNWWNGTADVAYSSGTSVDVTIGANSGAPGTITVSSGLTVNSLTFATVASSFYTLSGGSLTLTTGSISVITNASKTTGQGTLINTALSGSNGLTITGNGTYAAPSGGLIVLGATNTYTGTTTVTGYSTLRIASALALPSTTNLILNNGSFQSQLGGTSSFVGLGTGAGQIALTGSLADFGARTSALTVRIGTSLSSLQMGTTNFSATTLGLNSMGNLGGTNGAITLDNGLDLNGVNATLKVGANIATINGAITDTIGGSSLTLNDAGTNLVLLGNNTYTGATTIATGLVTLGNGGTLSNTSSITLTAAASVLSGSSSSAINLSAPISGLGSFRQMGSGTTTLAGLCTYSGSTSITKGMLIVGDGTTNGSLSGLTQISGTTGATLVFNRSDAVVVSNTIAGGLNFTHAGSGLLTLTGNGLTYSGTTTISSGTLQLGNGTVDGALTNSAAIVNNGTLFFNTKGNVTSAMPISGSGSVTMNGSGKQTLSGTNSYNGATAVTSGTLAFGGTGIGSKLTVGSGATLDLSFSGAAHAFTPTATSGVALTLADGSILHFGVGASSADQILLQGSASALVSGTVTLNFDTVGATNLSAYTLIGAPGGGLTVGAFKVGTVPTGQSASLSLTDTALQLNYQGLVPGYWKGGTSNVWSTYQNFTDATGATPLTQALQSSQDVIFSATGATNQNTVLGADTAIRSLTINDSAAVSIGGANTLTLGIVGGNAIASGSSAGAVTIGANVYLLGSGNIQVDGANGMLISGTVSGANGLTKWGVGTLTLGGVNSYTGATTIKGGMLSVSADNNLGATSGAIAFDPGAGNASTFQVGSSFSSNRAIAFTSGTGIIDTQANVWTVSGNTSGTGAFNKIGSGQLILSGSSFGNSGIGTVSSGTLTYTYPGTLGTTGSNSFSIAAGATLELSTTAAQNLAPIALSGVTFTGNGTLLKSGTAFLEMHGGGSAINMSMTGGTIHIAAGTVVNGGPSTGFVTGGVGNAGATNGSPTWTNNKATMQIDSGATFDIWDGNAVSVDALVGSGTLTRGGYGTAFTASFTFGANGGSGSFDGTITNTWGGINLTKSGTGTQILTGSNSYSGTTTVSAGTLRITKNTGLGFGGPVFGAETGAASVSGSTSTLDLNGGVTVNKVINLANGGSLINSSVGTVSVIDNGVAQVELLTTGSGYTNATISLGLTNNDTTGSGANVITGLATPPAGNAAATQLFVQTTATGSGYTIAPSVAILDSGTGTGATATALLSSVSVTGTTNIGGNGDLKVNAVISGTAGVVKKVGTGTLTLNGINTYTGLTSVTAGSLVVNGSISGTTSVVGGTLAGTGTALGPVTVNTGGTIAPGPLSAIGTLTTGALTLSNGSSVTINLGGATSSRVAANGDLKIGIINTDLITLNLNLLSPLTNDTVTPYTILSETDGLTLLQNGFFSSNGTTLTQDAIFSLTTGEQFQIHYGDYDVQLYALAVPEPSTFVSVLGGLALLAFSRRFRNQQRL